MRSTQRNKEVTEVIVHANKFEQALGVTKGMGLWQNCKLILLFPEWEPYNLLGGETVKKFAITD